MASSSSAPTSPSSPSPSSSAIPILRPGKSILKRPPPPQRGFFSLSTLSKLLPTSPTNPTPPNGSLGISRDSSLKRAHFILPQMSTVYPISSASPPYTPNIKEEKRNIEEKEAERRRRIVRSNSLIGPVEKEEDRWWSLEKVETFYTECCAGREEAANPAILAALRHAGTTSPRALDLSGIQLTPHAAAALSDILTIEWGLRKLVLRECDLDELTIKPLLHALLITNTLLFLSVASNRGMKSSSFKLVGAYMAKTKTLQYLDLSQNALDKRSMEYIVGSLGSAPPQVAGSGHSSPPASPRFEQPLLSITQPASPIFSLRVDDCSLRAATLEVLAHAVRTSPLRNISLRHNRISATGAVALALMIKDYPDSVPSVTTTTSAGVVPPSPTLPTPPALTSPSSPTPTISLPSKIKGGPIPPPPRHPTVAQAAPQTTYTPYIPKARRAVTAARAPMNVAPHPSSPPASGVQSTAVARTPTNSLPFGESVPLITSSAQGGVTTRHPLPRLSAISTTNSVKHVPHDNGPSAALLDRVRALDNLPKLGALRTLDLRGNDIRGGIMYIAQVLKRNRTLKILNLSENKIDVPGLVHLAEALKYNSCLETLDLSKNPCCGPGLEGIQSLRTAFTLNTSIKRLFLSSTSLTPAGAIALAEFLPESMSLLHLDLTVNNLDHAGVLALSVGLKANFTMRCLDLNIPAGNEEMARLCREILSCCVRNTEEAEKHARLAGAEDGNNRGAGKGVWGMIEESELARSVRTSNDPKNENDVLAQSRECKVQLEDLFSQMGASSSSAAQAGTRRELDPLLTRRTKALLPSLVALIQSTVDPAQLEELLSLNDALTSLLERGSPGSSGLTDGPQNSHQSPVDQRQPAHRRSSSSSNSLGLQNGNARGSPLPLSEAAADLVPGHTSDSDDQELFSPKVDKGKGKAMEEASPVLQKLIMSPSFSITDSDDDDEQRQAAEEVELDESGRPVPLPSPTDRSRSWVEEEGEIFRKGQALLSAEEMESEYAGEELRQGLLEAQVERPPARQLDRDADMFDEDLLAMANPTEPPETIELPKSPTVSSPRPYVARQRSTSFDNSKT